jgi:transcriptional regulator with XRE-family HTH domain
MTATGLAGKVNVGMTYISFIENLHTIPTPDMVVRIARALVISPEFLIRVAAKDETEKAIKRIKDKWNKPI